MFLFLRFHVAVEHSLLQFPSSMINTFYLGFRYVRVLGAFYLRITGSDTDVYQYLEPLYNDYRKLRSKLADGRKIQSP